MIDAYDNDEPERDDDGRIVPEPPARIEWGPVLVGLVGFFIAAELLAVVLHLITNP